MNDEQRTPFDNLKSEKEVDAQEAAELAEEAKLEADGYIDWLIEQENRKTLNKLAAVLRGKTSEQLARLFDSTATGERSKDQVPHE